jgi:hypothetical protein
MDALAMKLGIDKTAMIRARAGISFALTAAPWADVRTLSTCFASYARPFSNAAARLAGQPRPALDIMCHIEKWYLDRHLTKNRRNGAPANLRSSLCLRLARLWRFLRIVVADRAV